MSQKSKNDRSRSRKSEKISESQPASDISKIATDADNPKSKNFCKETDCFVCNKTVHNQDQALSCDCCEFWHHIECVGVSQEVYIFLNKSQQEGGIQWFCKKCDFGVKSILKTVVSMQQSQRAIEKRLDKVEEKVIKTEDLEAKLEKLEKSMKDLEDIQPRLEKLEGSVTKENITEMVKDINPENGNASYADELKKKAPVEVIKTSTIEEIRDRERRKLNLVLFNIPESEAEEIEQKKEDDAKEVDKFLEILDLKDIITLAKPVRLPKSKNPEHINKPKPLRVTATNEEERKIVLQKLKNATEKKKEKLKSIFVKKDMTPLERRELANRRNKLN